MAINIENLEDLDEINNKKDFSKIPNNFFYMDADILFKIGGRDSFVIYCLLTSRKSMNRMIYTSIKQISDALLLEKNVSRSKIRIIDSLLLLKKNKYIDFQDSLDKVKINDTIQIEWIELFPKLGGKGWIKFYEDDFELYKKIGNIPYCVMWILRMYKNYETQTSFISISDISYILECDRNKVQSAINLFRKTGLFDIVTGKYYYNEELGRKIRKNNSYSYTGEIESVLNTDKEEINKILFPSRKNKEGGRQI